MKISQKELFVQVKFSLNQLVSLELEMFVTAVIVTWRYIVIIWAVAQMKTVTLKQSIHLLNKSSGDTRKKKQILVFNPSHAEHAEEAN